MKSQVNLKRVVVLLDPRGVILSGGTDVIRRIESYGKDLKLNDSELKLLVFSGAKNYRNIYTPHLMIVNLYKPTFNSISFAIKAIKYLKINKFEPKLLIAGDPWESFWAAYFINKFGSQNIPIQTQIHGDIGNSSWIKMNLRNRVRFYLAKLSLPRSDQIRAVSKPQAKILTRKFGIENRSIKVVPVPIMNLNNKVSISTRRPNTIGFIGRIHQDRGILDFLSLVKALASIRQDFNLLIAGKGKDEVRFLKSLNSLVPKSRIQFLGNLNEKELKKIWKEMGVLVSTAPAESYGRVIREALVAGVPVWATKSSGVEDLKLTSGKKSLKILDISKDKKILNNELNFLLRANVLSSFRRKFIVDNSNYSKILTKSWIDLVKQYEFKSKIYKIN